ncbi:hypothetical protein [Synechococcus sp. W55.1]|uniref:hypothetical protein n=1 Tax=Synechococcus sp. W55.1 TaxID=2964512 RepID=UPI0039C4545E
MQQDSGNTERKGSLTAQPIWKLSHRQQAQYRDPSLGSSNTGPVFAAVAFGSQVPAVS